ncbi:MAG: beta-ketoacyl-[acyl-carrier-protein] synthase family protein [Deltaproteobacteria bacterium]|nr:beta-ketoacyl-[acyl-carrier-protein] synthase family protein [Deltaproteobacteria bacterium]
MPLKRVVITGMGAVTPFGPGVNRLFDALLTGKSAIRQHPELERVQGLRPRVAGLVRSIDISDIPRKVRRSMSSMSVYALLAAQEALHQGGVDEPLRSGGRLGVVLGSTVGSVDTMEEFFSQYLATKSVEQIKSMLFFRIMGHSCAANVAQALGVNGRTVAPSAACSTGCQAIGLGYEAILLGRQDLMLCGGADEFHPLTTATFDIMQAASTAFNDAPRQTPRPFDRDRDGMVCSEGAGIILLESLDSALERGVDILAEVAGFASTSDPTNIANPSSAPMRRCMELAVRDSGLTATDIDYINAHATGTMQGDISESAAIADLFGPEVPVSSLKGHLGHTMAASGAIELAACVKMLCNETLVPTRNLDNPAPECSKAHLLREVTRQPVVNLVKNNFALGGVNCSIVLRRFSHDG